MEIQLIYLAHIYEDNFNIVCDRFETDSANVMKYMSPVTKKQRKFQYYQATMRGTTTLKSFVSHTGL